LLVLAQLEFDCANDPSGAVERSSNCGEAGPDWMQKYRLKETWIPDANGPVKTLHVNINLWQRADGTGNLQNTSDGLTRMEQVINWVDDNYRDNSVIDPSLSYPIPFIEYSNIRVVLDSVYFYPDPTPDSSYYFGGWTYSSYSHTLRLDSYLDSLYPERTKALNLHIFKGSYGSTNVGGYSHSGSIGTYLKQDFDVNSGHDFWLSGHWTHEIGHAFDLWHLYDAGWSQNCNSVYNDFLWDVYDTTVSCTSNCEICLIGTTTNNFMTRNGITHHVSPLQMGVMQRSSVLNNFHNYNFGIRDKLTGYSAIPFEVTEDEVWDFSMKFYQDLVVRSGATLTVQCELQFVPEAGIIVEPGGALILDGGVLTNEHFYEDSWRGIEVWGNSAQHQFGPTANTMYTLSPHQGRVELRNGWIIANARNAIRMEQPGVPETSGGFVIARDGEFRNCGQALDFKEYRNFHPTQPGLTRQNRSRFYNVKFIIDDSYTVDVPFQEHVKLTGVNGIYFHGCNFENTRLNVTESHVLGYGIYSMDANYTVGPKCFGYLPGNIYQPCPEIWLVPSQFKGLDHGIHARSANGLQSYHVEHTTFTNNVCGIYSEGVVGFKVLNSKFEVGGNQATILTNLIEENWEQTHRALFTTTGYGFLIEDNQLHKVGAAPSEGIVVGYSGGHNDMVFRNNAHNLDAAYIGEGICADVDARAYIGLNFQCNTNDDNQRNLWSRFVSSDPLTAADQTIRTNQGQLERAGDNEFDGNNVNLDIDNTNNLTNVLTYWWQTPASPFKPVLISDGVIVTDNYNNLPVLRPEGNCASRNVLLTAYPTTNPGPVTDGMMIHGTDYTNSAYLHKQLIDGGNTDQMVEDVIAVWPEEVWTLRSYLLEESPFLSVDELKEMVNKPFLPVAIKAEICIANPDATKKEGFVKWLRYEAGTPMPESLINNIEASWDTKTFRTQLEGTMAHQHGEMTQKAHLLMNYYTSDTLDHTDSLRWVWQQIRTPAARYAEALSYMEEGNYDAARGVIEDLPEEHDLNAKEDSERNRMLAFIDFLSPIHGSGRNNAEFSVAEQNALEGIIADQRDRPATWAQNILCFYYGKCRAPLTGGDGGTPKSRRSNGASIPVQWVSNLRMYPNPANNYVVFEVDLGAEAQHAAIVIEDITGRSLQRLIISNKEQQLAFDTRALAPGSYTVQLLNGSRRLETKNLIIRQ